MNDHGKVSYVALWGFRLFWPIRENLAAAWAALKSAFLRIVRPSFPAYPLLGRGYRGCAPPDLQKFSTEGVDRGIAERYDITS